MLTSTASVEHRQATLRLYWLDYLSLFVLSLPECLLEAFLMICTFFSLQQGCSAGIA